MGALAAGVAACVGVCAAGDAQAHWSASYRRSLLVERYLTCDDDLDVACVGPVAAAGTLRAALAPIELAPDRNDAVAVEAAREAAVWAAYTDDRSAVPSLRAMLTMPLPAALRDTHAEFDVHALQAEAAYALAALGDRSSADAVVTLLRELEVHGHGSLWADTLEALTRLDVQAASRYAIGFLARLELADMRMSMPGGSSQLVALVPIVAAHDRAALGELRRLSAGEDATAHGEPRVPLTDAHAFCQVVATRLSLGDEPLRTRVRKAFAGSYSGTMVATCDAALLRTFGDDVADVDILLRHVGRDDLGFDAPMSLVAYDRIIALLARLHGRSDAASRRARAQLREGLRARSGYPHVAQPEHRNYAPQFELLHHAALAAAGDVDALARVTAFADAADDRSGLADLAALRALQLQLPGAAELAAARLARDVAFANDERSGIFAGARVRLLEALVAQRPDDPRWAVALVDADIEVREHALAAYSRRAPARSCEVVLAAARDATARGVDDGLLALTTRGDGCRPQLAALADDADARDELRGMAIEALAILGVAPSRALQRHPPEGLRQHLQRAAVISRGLETLARRRTRR